MATTLAAICPGCFRHKGGEVAVCPQCGYDASASRSPLLLPALIRLNQRYLIGRTLGKPGGFGVTYLAFSLLLARESNRPVDVRESGPTGDAGAGCGLFLMAVEEYLAEREEKGLVALYAVDRSAHGRDRAVVIARPANAPLSDFSGIGTEQCVFSGPRSLNGCWVQLELLEAEGFRAAEGYRSLHFPEAGGAARVVFSVLFEGYTLGACRRSDIDDLTADGSIAEDEVAVIRSGPAVPELVFACRGSDAVYFGHVLEGFALRLANPGDDPEEQVAAALLARGGMRSVRPITGEEITRAAALLGRMTGENREGVSRP